MHIVRDRISDRVGEQIIDDHIPAGSPGQKIQDHIDDFVTVMPEEFDGRKLESTMKDGSDLGDEDEENKLERAEGYDRC